jgi:hypothetical protein
MISLSQPALVQLSGVCENQTPVIFYSIPESEIRTVSSMQQYTTELLTTCQEGIWIL